MRLWHYQLIQVLPRQQLLGQWRECCLIVKSIIDKGTPNHLLVNPVMDYPIDHLFVYAQKVWDEMNRRGYHADWSRFGNVISVIQESFCIVEDRELFNGWHNNRYLWQCYLNLEEKHDRGGIGNEEWSRIESFWKRRRNSFYEATMAGRR